MIISYSIKKQKKKKKKRERKKRNEPKKRTCQIKTKLLDLKFRIILDYNKSSNNFKYKYDVVVSVPNQYTVGS